MSMTENKIKPTIEQVIYCLKAECERYGEVCEECSLYGEVGCDHCYDDVTDVAIKCLKELEQYRAIGTVEEFKALKEKNEPKKIIDIKKSECTEDIEYFGSDELFGKCPHCEGMVNHTWNPCSCGDCGGLIDLSE